MPKRLWTRPGVAAAFRLSQRPNEPQVWAQTEAQYRDMLQAKGGDALLSLDDFCEALGKRLQSSKITGGLTKEELLQVVEWKFAKGKARPALRKHLQANSEAQVEQKTREGLEIASGTEESAEKAAIEVISELRGVGPATASAILSLYCPDRFAFMDDEVIECLYDKKRDYRLSTYLSVNAKCQQLAATLGWTPRRVGKALWTASRIVATGGEDLTANMTKAKSKGLEKVEETDSPKRKRRRK